MVAKASEKHFSISKAINFGFNFFRENLLTFIKLGAVVIGLNIITNIIIGAFAEKGSLLAGILSLVGAVVSLIVQVGMTKILLDLHDGKKVNFSHLWSHYHLVITYFLASLLYGLMVVVGLILLIVPGVYLALKFQFYGFLIVDKKMGVMDSLKKSSEMTEGSMWNLFLFALLLLVINFAGALIFGIGLLVTIPTSLMATIYVYRKLLSKNS
jgi:uncharacterized membrane protein